LRGGEKKGLKRARFVGRKRINRMKKSKRRPPTNKKRGEEEITLPRQSKKEVPQRRAIGGGAKTRGEIARRKKNSTC